MGYPMTYRRVVNRNDLRGDYGSKLTGVAFDAVIQNKWSLLQGDLRRLEKDAVDERAICEAIALKLMLDKELVAAVIREFMAL